MELGEYDHRLGANDPTDFPGERFKEKELESNPSDSTGIFHSQIRGLQRTLFESVGQVRADAFFWARVIFD